YKNENFNPTQRITGNQAPVAPSKKIAKEELEKWIFMVSLLEKIQQIESEKEKIATQNLSSSSATN
ncbi:hypothetical protein HDU92_007936, partial [Lobulomyces angularis]